MWRLIKEIFTYTPTDLKTDIDSVLTYLNRVVKRHSIVFVISDCMDSGFEKSLNLAARKHDLTVIRISDPAEKTLPAPGLMMVKDPETGQTSVINTRSKMLKDNWLAYIKAHGEYLTDMFQKAGVDFVEIETSGSVVEPLTRLFDRRKRRL